MNTKLYVGNLSYQTTDDELREMFAPAGAVMSVAIPTDRATGQPRGFAFVEMSTTAEAQKAISMCNGRMLGQRQIRVSLSEPKDSHRPPSQPHKSGRSSGGSGNQRY
jgi:cold-inducible RNA-binding protein